MSFAFDLQRFSPEHLAEPSLEDRLLSVEAKFIRRVVEGMPLPHAIPQAREADEIVNEMVANAFKRWFAPQRRLFIETWNTDERILTESIEYAYGMFLEKVALRRGGRIVSEHDGWERASLPQELEAAAEAFRCAIQQREGWIELYGACSGVDGRHERLAYLQVANLARGFLGVRQANPGEKARLADVQLVPQGGVVLPPRVLGRVGEVDPVTREMCVAFDIGRQYRQKYEERMQLSAAQHQERRAFAEVVQHALQGFGKMTLVGPHLAASVRRYAEFCIELEARMHTALADREQVKTGEERNIADRRLDALREQQIGAREALAKARALLRVYEEAKHLGLVLPEEEDRPVRLMNIVKRLAS